MGRRRSIDRDAVLDAAQRVVNRDGVARLTLEAVAAEAKISKASVLYDYKTKQALIKAVIARRVAAEDARVQQHIDALGPVSDSPIRGRLAAAAQTPPASARAVDIHLCAALAQTAELREPIQKLFRDRIDEIFSTSPKPRGAMLAFLAVEGLLTMEWFGLKVWTEAERKELLADMSWLVDQTPRAPADGAPADIAP